MIIDIFQVLVCGSVTHYFKAGISIAVGKQLTEYFPVLASTSQIVISALIVFMALHVK